MERKKQQDKILKKRIRDILYSTILCFAIIIGAVGCQSSSNNNTTYEAPIVSEDKQLARIHFIDTGNSDAILIEQQGHAALIDGGDNNDETLVVDYIKRLGIQSLDYVIATHPDADHIGGLDAVISQLEVNQVLVGNGKATTKTYTDFIEAIMNKGLTPSVPLLGSTFSLGEASLKVLSVANEKDVNNCSLVMLYTYDDTKVLFMGDADQSIEKNIDLNAVGDVDLIKVGHHGSKTSSNETFVKGVSPEYAVITCGTGNKYGHPDQETLDVLEHLEITTYRTDQMGDIIFEITEQGISLLNDVPEQGIGINSEKQEGTQSNNSIVETMQDSEEAKVESVEAFNPSETKNIVYFTESGKRYHSNANCSDMKNPITASIDEVEGRTPCQKCYN